LDTLFLSFANQQHEILPTLQEEDDALYRLLAPRAQAQHFLLHRDSYVTLDKLPSYLTLYRDTLSIFLFSGHAGRDRLLLGGGGIANSDGVAQMLGQCPQLKLVMLNGCSTEGQVSQLLDYGIPIVIATSAPVSDRSATFFSMHFFEALEKQFSIREAFDMAKGATEAAFSSITMAVHRNIKRNPDTAVVPVWGMFFLDKNEHVTAWKFPAKAPARIESADGFTPNLHLIDVLFNALGAYNEDIQKLAKQAERGVQVPLPKKRMAVLNALPAPLAEPLRKLLVPVEQENEGFDKVSEARLRQIAQAYSTTMELLAFTMLAQLWEAHDSVDQLAISTAQQDALRSFFRLSKSDREAIDLTELIAVIKGIFDQNKISYFVQELLEINELLRTDPVFAQSLELLNGLRLQLRQNTFDRAALSYLSNRAEYALANLYAHMGFMARYRLATIQGIDVEKYRHRREPTFNHATVMLHDLLGGFDVSQVHLNRSLDNRSILLLNEETWEYLNLSPFVIDENAFHDRAEICKLYFFSYWSKAAGTLFFKYVNKPDDPLLEVSNQYLPLVKEQFEAFSDLILQQPLAEL